VGGKKILARLASGFVFLLANSKFYSHLASWLVVIRTPDVRTPPTASVLPLVKVTTDLKVVQYFHFLLI
jgi:hypothetical protein